MKKLYIIIILIVAIALGLVVFGSKPVLVVTETPSDNSASVISATTGQTYTLADVSIHADTNSCWTVIRDQVYDLTTWVSAHPGGKVGIIKTCGKDATDLFVNKHGGRSAQEEMLATFKIGELAK